MGRKKWRRNSRRWTRTGNYSSNACKRSWRLARSTLRKFNEELTKIGGSCARKWMESREKLPQSVRPLVGLRSKGRRCRSLKSRFRFVAFSEEGARTVRTRAEVVLCPGCEELPCG